MGGHAPKYTVGRSDVPENICKKQKWTNIRDAEAAKTRLCPSGISVDPINPGDWT